MTWPFSGEHQEQFWALFRYKREDQINKISLSFPVVQNCQEVKVEHYYLYSPRTQRIAERAAGSEIVSTNLAMCSIISV